MHISLLRRIGAVVGLIAATAVAFAQSALPVLSYSDISAYRIVVLTIPDRFAERLVPIEAIVSELGAESYMTLDDLLAADETRPDAVIIDHTALDLLDRDDETLARWYRDGTIIVGIRLTMDEMSIITRDPCMRYEVSIPEMFFQRPYYVHFGVGLLSSGSDTGELIPLNDCDKSNRERTRTVSRGGGVWWLEQRSDIETLRLRLARRLTAQEPATDCPEAAAVLPVIVQIATEHADEPDIAIELIYTAVQEVRSKCRPAPFYEPRLQEPPSLDADFFAPLPVERLEDGGFVLGNPQARVTIVLFTDWYCPACQQYKPTIDQFLRNYVAKGKARLELRTLPTAGATAQPNTTQVADLLECVNEQKPGSYFYASEIAFELILQGTRGADFSQGLTDRTDVTFPELLRCTQDASQEAADLRFARDLGVSSTPMVFYRVDGERPQRLSNRSMEGIAAIVDALQ